MCHVRIRFCFLRKRELSKKIKIKKKNLMMMDKDITCDGAV